MVWTLKYAPAAVAYALISRYIAEHQNSDVSTIMLPLELIVNYYKKNNRVKPGGMRKNQAT